MEVGWTFIAYVAAFGVWFRFLRFFQTKSSFENAGKFTPVPVSIIVPVRNEKDVIRKVLDSLMQIQYAELEIIVIDDGSTDDTAALASVYPVKVLHAPPKPLGWAGKNWACHIGAQSASNNFLLFTDADTVHAPDSLKRAMKFLQDSKSHLISAPSYHKNELWWEKLLGPFYCLMHAGVSPHDRISIDNPYAIGQYLLFEKEFYESIGGHAAVHEEIAEDAAIARRVMAYDGRYSVYCGTPLFQVQMYKTFLGFWNGWGRILRLGMRELRPGLIINTLLPLLALNIPNMMVLTITSFIPVISTLLCFSLVQRKTGDFSVAGIFLFPIPVSLFVVLSSWAVFCHIFNLPVSWRGRKYFLKDRSFSGNG